jgi:hypothetical protein
LSFDQRILGYADESVIPDLDTPHDLEYISHDEVLAFLGPNPADLEVWTDDNAVWTAEDFAAIEPVMVAEIHRKFLINNIVHILWVANKNPAIGAARAAKQICIGTDFDGLINAIDCCKETTGLKQLKADMQDEMKTMLSKVGIGTIDSTQLLEDIFYNNGKNFMLNRLRVMNRP